jgi:hypothetical protein
MKINFNTIPSLAALTSAIVYLHDLFLFSKVQRNPDWAKYLPDILPPTWAIVFVCLLLFFVNFKKIHSNINNILLVAALAPLLALLFIIILTKYSNFENLIPQYIWILLFHIAIPTALIILLEII